MLSIVPSQQATPATQPSFDDFWLMYPKRVAKKDARRAWERLKAEQRMEALVALMDWRRVWTDRGDLQFVPNGATWLNGERWTDELPPEYVARRDRGERIMAERQKVVEERKQSAPMPEKLRKMLEDMRK